MPGLVSDGSYGVPEGLISSFPTHAVDGEWQVIGGVDINDFSRRKIDAPVAELIEERDAHADRGQQIASDGRRTLAETSDGHPARG